MESCYTTSELETVKKAVLEGIRRAKNISEAGVESIEVCESCYTNIKVELGLVGAVCIGFDDLAEIAEKVRKTNLGSVFVVDGKAFPLDFKIHAGSDKTWLELWF